MFSGGDQTKISNDAKKFFCGGAFRPSFDPATEGDPTCKQNVDNELAGAYTQITDPKQRDNLEAYLRAWVGQPYFECLISSGISARGANKTTGPVGMTCMSEYTNSTRKIDIIGLNSNTSTLRLNAFGEYVPWAVGMVQAGIPALPPALLTFLTRYKNPGIKAGVRKIFEEVKATHPNVDENDAAEQLVKYLTPIMQAVDDADKELVVAKQATQDAQTALKADPTNTALQGTPGTAKANEQAKSDAYDAALKVAHPTKVVDTRLTGSTLRTGTGAGPGKYDLTFGPSFGLSPELDAYLNDPQMRPLGAGLSTQAKALAPPNSDPVEIDKKIKEYIEGVVAPAIAALNLAGGNQSDPAFLAEYHKALDKLRSAYVDGVTVTRDAAGQPTYKVDIQDKQCPAVGAGGAQAAQGVPTDLQGYLDAMLNPAINAIQGAGVFTPWINHMSKRLYDEAMAKVLEAERAAASPKVSDQVIAKLRGWLAGLQAAVAVNPADTKATVDAYINQILRTIVWDVAAAPAYTVAFAEVPPELYDNGKLGVPAGIPFDIYEDVYTALRQKFIEGLDKYLNEKVDGTEVSKQLTNANILDLLKALAEELAKAIKDEAPGNFQKIVEVLSGLSVKKVWVDGGSKKASGVELKEAEKPSKPKKHGTLTAIGMVGGVKPTTETTGEQGGGAGGAIVKVQGSLNLPFGELLPTGAYLGFIQPPTSDLTPDGAASTRTHGSPEPSTINKINELYLGWKIEHVWRRLSISNILAGGLTEARPHNHKDAAKAAFNDDWNMHWGSPTALGGSKAFGVSEMLSLGVGKKDDPYLTTSLWLFGGTAVSDIMHKKADGTRWGVGVLLALYLLRWVGINKRRRSLEILAGGSYQELGGTTGDTPLDATLTRADVSVGYIQKYLVARGGMRWSRQTAPNKPDEDILTLVGSLAFPISIKKFLGGFTITPYTGFATGNSSSEPATGGTEGPSDVTKVCPEGDPERSCSISRSQLFGSRKNEHFVGLNFGFGNYEVNFNVSTLWDAPLLPKKDNPAEKVAAPILGVFMLTVSGEYELFSK